MDPNTPTVKHIAGQAIYQLAVMYGLIFYAPALLGIPGMGGAGLGVPAAAPAGWTGCKCAAALRPPPAQPATASRPPTTRLLPAGSWVVVAGSSKHSSTADAQRSALLSQCQPTCSTDTQIASFCSLQTTRLWLAPASTTPWYSTHLSSCRQACACRFWLLLLCPLLCQLLRPLRPLLLPPGCIMRRLLGPWQALRPTMRVGSAQLPRALSSQVGARCLLRHHCLQLFNQLNARKIIDTSLAWEGLSNAKWFQVRVLIAMCACGLRSDVRLRA